MIDSPDRSKRRRALWVGLAIVLLVSLVQYLPSLQNAFVWDSKGAFLDDPTITDVRHLPRYFTESFTLAAPDVAPPPGLQVSHVRYYRPVTKTFRLLEYSLFGTNPLGYKAMNVLLNAVVVALAFLFVLRATDDFRLALASSLLYAVNPTRAEVVCWAYSDASILAALFSLMALLLYQRERYALSLAAAGLALLSHEGAIVLPVVVVVYESLVHDRSGRAFGRVVPFFFLVGAYLVVRNAIAGPAPITDVGALTLANSVAVIVARFVRLWFVPDTPLTVHLLEEGMFSTPSLEVAISWAVVLGLGGLAAVLWSKKRRAVFWIAWFLVWASITFNVGSFGDYLLAEKTLYLASLGPAVLLSYAATRDRVRSVGTVLLGGLFVFHFVTTFSRTRHWKDTITYLEAAVRSAPEFEVARYALANEYVAKKEYAEALEQYEATLVRRPDLVFLRGPIADMHFALGNEHAEAGRLDEAVVEFERCLESNPAHSGALNNSGTAEFLKGNMAKARRYWERATVADPVNPQPHHNLALLLEREGDIEGALRHYRHHASLLSEPSAALRAKISKLEAQRSASEGSRTPAPQ